MKQEAGIILTIIIPHYNTPHYLRRLLDTIPQDIPIQTIVIDDRSNELLPEYEECKSYFSDRGVLFLRNEGEKGAGASRNVGLRHAVGKWLLFADADDYFCEGFYDILRPYLSETADIIYFPLTSKEEGSERESHRHLEMAELICQYRDHPNLENEVNLKYRFVVPTSKLIRKDLVDKNQVFFDEVMHSNDVMFSIKTAYYSKQIAVATTAIYCLVRNNTSLTSLVNADSYRQRISVWINRYLFLRDNLSRKEFRVLDLYGMGRILYGVKGRVGFKILYQTIQTLRQNQIHIFPRRIFRVRSLWKWLQIQKTVQTDERRFLRKH